MNQNGRSSISSQSWTPIVRSSVQQADEILISQEGSGRRNEQPPTPLRIFWDIMEVAWREPTTSKELQLDLEH